MVKTGWRQADSAAACGFRDALFLPENPKAAHGAAASRAKGTFPQHRFSSGSPSVFVAAISVCDLCVTFFCPRLQANQALLKAENFRVFLGLTVMLLNQIRRRCNLREVNAVHVADLEDVLFRTRTQNNALAKRSLAFYMLQRIRSVFWNPVAALTSLLLSIAVHPFHVKCDGPALSGGESHAHFVSFGRLSAKMKSSLAYKIW